MKYYHISFKGNLAGLWEPKTPAGGDSKGNMTEPDTPRICVSPTIGKCFQAIYSNVSKYFEKENYPYMEFYVYAPEHVLRKDIIYPDELTKKRFVWDAWVTDEHWLLVPTVMKLVGKVRIMNTNENESMSGHPFNDKKIKVRYMFPKNIEIKKISGEIPSSALR